MWCSAATCLGDATPIKGEDYLGFAGIAAPELLLIPVETHIAEKLHAYTLPRPTPNSRVRDLPDLALLAAVPTRSSAIASLRPCVRRFKRDRIASAVRAYGAPGSSGDSTR